MDNLKDIEVEDFDDHVVAYIYGSLTISNVKDVDEILTKELERDLEAVGINCSYLTHIDSISINHIVKFSKMALNKGVDVLIFGLNQHIEDIFTTINLHKLVKITTKEEFEKMYSKKPLS